MHRAGSRKLPGVTGARSKQESSVTLGFSFRRRDRGWPMPPAAPSTATLKPRCCWVAIVALCRENWNQCLPVQQPSCSSFRCCLSSFNRMQFFSQPDGRIRSACRSAGHASSLRACTWVWGGSNRKGQRRQRGRASVKAAREVFAMIE